MRMVDISLSCGILFIGGSQGVNMYQSKATGVGALTFAGAAATVALSLAHAGFQASIAGGDTATAALTDPNALSSVAGRRSRPLGHFARVFQAYRSGFIQHRIMGCAGFAACIEY